mmetsp:Transcript_19080/g.47938  ORF Transcript_19080/g.47938 Transcript_19080/m.47938 type:complete len:213 (-) Transcript_19080:11-649(-)
MRRDLRAHLVLRLLQLPHRLLCLRGLLVLHGLLGGCSANATRQRHIPRLLLQGEKDLHLPVLCESAPGLDDLDNLWVDVLCIRRREVLVGCGELFDFAAHRGFVGAFIHHPVQTQVRVPIRRLREDDLRAQVFRDVELIWAEVVLRASPKSAVPRGVPLEEVAPRQERCGREAFPGDLQYKDCEMIEMYRPVSTQPVRWSAGAAETEHTPQM